MPIDIFTKLPGKLRDIVLFSVLSVGVFLMAVFYQYLAVPSHVMAKAKYMLGIIPCFAVLGAVGLESVLRNRSRVLRGFVLGILICWGLSVYTGYFIWKVSDELNIIDHYKLAHDLMGRGNIVEAADQYLSIKQINPYAMKVPPEFIKALNLNMRSLVNTGDQKAAIKILMKLKEFQPDNASIYYNIACLYAKQDKRNEAVSWLREAVHRGFRDWELIMNDPDLNNIRDNHEVRKLMQKVGE